MEKKAVPVLQKQKTSLKELISQLHSGDRGALSRAITLVESTAAKDKDERLTLLRTIMPEAGKSLRIGVTGVPGVGKSTFIDALGAHLLSLGKRVAVLAIDPSSPLSGGSILGDKTRMTKLVAHESAFVRPSPTRGMLGGVASSSRETIAVCEYAGFDVVIVETVGVGQSEFVVREMVDIYVLLCLTGAGDELQAIKRGMLELVDLIVVNKADGENEIAAKNLAQELSMISKKASDSNSESRKALSCSSTTAVGVPEIWNALDVLLQKHKKTGVFQQRRKEQGIKAFEDMITLELQSQFFAEAAKRETFAESKNKVASGALSAFAAFDQLFHSKKEVNNG